MCINPRSTLPLIGSAKDGITMALEQNTVCHHANQLFTAGVLRLQHSNLTALDFSHLVDEHYGTEEEGFMANEHEGVPIPCSRVHLSEEQMAQLQLQHPLTDDGNHGIDLYRNVLQFISDTSITQ